LGIVVELGALEEDIAVDIEEDIVEAGTAGIGHNNNS